MKWMIIGLAALGIACSSEPTPDANDADDTSELPDFTTGLELAARDFGVDPYEIGREWYAYNGSVHVVTPEPWVYVFTRGDAMWAVDITSYYDDRGESGVFTLSAASFADGWGEPEELTLSTNVKEEPGCVRLEPFEQVECTADYDLVFRTAWRALPDGGFAVQEPAVFVRNHFSFGEDPMEVAIVEAEQIGELPTDAEALAALERRPSVAVDPLHGRVGWVHDDPTAAPRTDVQLHITSNMQIAQWRIDSLTPGADITVDLSVRCQRVLLGEQAPFGADAESFTVMLPAGERYSGALVRLCDPERDDGVAGEVVDTITSPPLGLWPDAKTFDLIVEQLDGRVLIRLAPGHLLWNWTRGAEDDSETFDPIDLDAVWAQHYEAE